MDNDPNPTGSYFFNPPPGFPPVPYQTSAQNIAPTPPGPNAWSGNLYSQPPFQSAPEARSWPPIPPPPPPPGQVADCRYPPQYQAPPGIQRHSYPHIPPPFEFDPSRPPPGFCEPMVNPISAFIEAQRNASNVRQRQPDFPSHSVGISGQWPSGQSSGAQKRDDDRPVPPDFSNQSGHPVGAHPHVGNKGYQRSISDTFKDPQTLQPAEQQDQASIQRDQDEKWLQNFLTCRRQKPVPKKVITPAPSLSQVRDSVYGAVKLVSELSLLCQTLKQNMENDTVWSESYNQATGLRKAIEEKITFLSDQEMISSAKKKLVVIQKKRIRVKRQKIERFEEEQKQEQQLAERHATIDKWRLKRIQQVEEKKLEEELKRAADSVLAEVRKKQGDAKKMLDILKALEKLRKLRKEAAARKGVFPEKESDEVFDGHLSRLRALIGKRTAVYNAEENTLRVMLEGEQEEERKREMQKRQKREQDRLLQKKKLVEAMLFGDELPADPLLQPFQDFHLQAESSLPLLVQIRRDWDHYLVPEEHPDGSAIPQAWVLPEPPADEAWASALQEHISLSH